MTRSEFNRTLRFMERVREQSYEAETKREERRLLAEYRRMNAAIEPYATGKLKLIEDNPDPAAEAAAWSAGL